jgi:hypothetical protein
MPSLFADSDEVIQPQNAPQEERRLQVPKTFLEETIQSLYDGH